MLMVFYIVKNIELPERKEFSWIVIYKPEPEGHYLYR